MKSGDNPDGTRQISASGPGYRGPGAAAKLDVTPSSATPAVSAALETRAAVMKAMQGHVLGKAVYVGLFHRPQ